MKITFSRSECEYIVQCPETDLMLTRIGLTLIDALEKSSEEIEVDASGTDYEEFLDTLREEYEWKIERLPDRRHLMSLAQRLLPDFQSLIPRKWANQTPQHNAGIGPAILDSATPPHPALSSDKTARTQSPRG